MPCDYKKYHPNWKQISQSIVRDRAKNHCELCLIKNASHVARSGDGLDWFYCTAQDKERYSIYNYRVVKIVLTVHHIDYDIKNNKPYNLLALCQRCHNKLDMPLRIRNRQKKKQSK